MKNAHVIRRSPKGVASLVADGAPADAITAWQTAKLEPGESLELWGATESSPRIRGGDLAGDDFLRIQAAENAKMLEAKAAKSTAKPKAKSPEEIDKTKPEAAKIKAAHNLRFQSQTKTSKSTIP